MPGYRKLGKTSDQRRAMLRQLVTDLLENGRIDRKKLAELNTVTEIRVHRGTGYSLERKTDSGEKK